MMEPTKLKQLLVAAMPDATVEITDLTGTKDHYKVQITSDAFNGKSRLERHRLVYGALGDAIGGAVHALSLEARTHTELSAR